MGPCWIISVLIFCVIGTSEELRENLQLKLTATIFLQPAQPPTASLNPLNRTQFFRRPSTIPASYSGPMNNIAVNSSAFPVSASPMG